MAWAAHASLVAKRLRRQSEEDRSGFGTKFASEQKTGGVRHPVVHTREGGVVERGVVSLAVGVPRPRLQILDRVAAHVIAAVGEWRAAMRRLPIHIHHRALGDPLAVPDRQQSLDVLLVPCAPHLAPLRELEVDAGVPNHNPGMSSLQGHPELPFPDLRDVELGLRLPRVVPVAWECMGLVYNST